jgi:hypothetical protein
MLAHSAMKAAAVLFLASTATTTHGFVLPSSNPHHGHNNMALHAVTVEQWEILPDGRLQGVIFPDGDQVTTSPLRDVQRARPRRTVTTLSGSKYKLGQARTADDNVVVVATASMMSQSTTQPTTTTTTASFNNNDLFVVRQVSSLHSMFVQCNDMQNSHLVS